MKYQNITITNNVITFNGKEYKTMAAAKSAKRAYDAKLQKEQAAQLQENQKEIEEANADPKKKAERAKTKITKVAKKDHEYNINQRRQAANKEINSIAGWLKALYNTSAPELAFIRKCNKAGLFALASQIEKDMEIGKEYTTKKGTYVRKVSKDIVLRWLHKNEKELVTMCKGI